LSMPVSSSLTIHFITGPTSRIQKAHFSTPHKDSIDMSLVLLTLDPCSAPQIDLVPCHQLKAYKQVLLIVPYSKDANDTCIVCRCHKYHKRDFSAPIVFWYRMQIQVSRPQEEVLQFQCQEQHCGNNGFSRHPSCLTIVVALDTVHFPLHYQQLHGKQCCKVYQ
jgi:hypothetical protein